MLKIAIALFVLAAVFGLINLFAILTNRPTPKPAVFIHGALAVVALLIVVYFAATTSGPVPLISLGLFVLAALGGLYLFVTDLSKKPVSKVVAIVHPLVAVSGLIALILFVVKTL